MSFGNPDISQKQKNTPNGEISQNTGVRKGRRMSGERVASPFFDDRFPAIPMYSGRPWFLPLVGVYYQVKDWLQ